MDKRRRSIAERLDRACRKAGHPIEGVSIGDPSDRSTWVVHPGTLADACQPIVQVFDPDDAADELEAKARELSASREIRATLTVIVRGRDVAAWDAMTSKQRKALVDAEVEAWVEAYIAAGSVSSPPLVPPVITNLSVS